MPAPAASAQVGPEVDALGAVGRLQGGHPVPERRPQLGRLLLGQVGQGAHVAERAATIRWPLA